MKASRSSAILLGTKRRLVPSLQGGSQPHQLPSYLVPISILDDVHRCGITPGVGWAAALPSLPMLVYTNTKRVGDYFVGTNHRKNETRCSLSTTTSPPPVQQDNEDDIPPEHHQGYDTDRDYYNGNRREYVDNEKDDLDDDEEDMDYQTYSDKSRNRRSNNGRQKQFNSNTKNHDRTDKQESDGDGDDGGGKDDRISNENTMKRIWLDPQSPVQDRVFRFVNQRLGSVHPLDMKLTSVDLIRECGKLRSFNGMKLAQDILDRLIEEKKFVNIQQSTTSLVVIPDRPFKVVMYGWSNLCRKVQFAPQRMRDVLQLMIQESEYDKKMKREVEESLQEQCEIIPHSSTVPARNPDENNTTEVGGGIPVNDHVDVDVDVDVDDDVASYDPKDEGRSCEPTVDIYNTLLQGLSEAATSSIAAAIEAQDALSTMEKMNRTKGWHTKPNTRSYSLVLNSYAKARHPTSGSRAEAVLRGMIVAHEREIQAYRDEYGVDYDEIDLSTNHRRIVTPDTIAYTSVIQAYGQSDCPDAAENALRILMELLQSDQPALTPDAYIFANTINAFSRMADQKKSAQARVDAAQRAEDVLWLMVDELKNTPESRNSEGQHPLAGNIVPFNACLNAWARSYAAESPHRAERLLFQLLEPELQKLIQVYPNTVSFNTCMQAWAKSSKLETTSSSSSSDPKETFSAPEKAEEILRLLQDMSKTSSESNDGDTRKPIVRPDVQSYVTVMNAYASSGGKQSVYHARRLFNELFRDGQYHTDRKGINAAAFTVVLKAAAKAGNVGALDSTKDDFATPSSAWGGSGSDDSNNNEIGGEITDPYLIALEVYSELQNDTFDLQVTGDHFAYAAMLDVIAVHTDVNSIERRQRVEEIFHDACQAGHVSSVVVKSLERACPNEYLLKDLLRLKRDVGGILSLESVNVFPKQWTQFVPPDFRRITSRKDHFRTEREHFRTKRDGGNKKEYHQQRSGNKKENQQQRKSSG